MSLEMTIILLIAAFAFGVEVGQRNSLRFLRALLRYPETKK